MKFRCQECNAQYMIADEKLGKKGVRVRCKKCGEVITVLPPDQTEADQREEESLSAGPDEQEQGMGSEEGQEESWQDEQEEEQVEQDEDEEEEEGEGDGEQPASEEEDELKSALSDILGDEEEEEPEPDPFAGASDDDMDRQATRVFNMEEMQQVKDERRMAAEDEEEDEGDSDSFGVSGGAEADAGGDRDKAEWYAAVDEKQVGPMSLNEFAEHFEQGEYDAETLVWKAGFDEWLPAYEVADFQFLVEDGGDDYDSTSEEDEGESPDEEAPSDDDSAWRFEGEASAQDEEGEATSGDYPSDESDFGEDETQADGGYFGEDEESESASAAAFAGADVDWKPSALSSLSSLAEEELSSLKPEDPEPEEEFPFGDDEEEAMPDSAEGAFAAASDEEPAVDEDEGAEEGDAEEDSSLIAQIAAEEEAAAAEAERERIEQERLAEEARKKAEEEALAAQEAARREQYEEKRERAAPPEEQFIPERTGMAKQMKMLIIGGGVALFVMFATTIGVVIWATNKDETPTTPQAMQPVQPAAQPGAQDGVQPGTQPAVQPGTQPAVQPGTQPGVQPGTQPGVQPGTQPGVQPGVQPGTQPGVQPGVQPGTQPGAQPAANPTAPTTDKKEPDGQKAVAKAGTSPKPKKPRDRKKRRRRRRTKPKPRPAPEIKEDKPKVEKKPVRRKPKGGILDFEDEDDRALAAEMGVKDRPSAKPKKKELPPLSNGDVLVVMRKHIAEFKACNRKQKQLDSSVRGKMVVNFTIATSGKVAKVKVSGAGFGGSYVAKCVSGVIKRLKFPKFGGKPKKVPFPFKVN